MFGADTCNAIGSTLIYFLNEWFVMVEAWFQSLNGLELWTRVRPSLYQKSNYVTTDVQLMAASGDVHIYKGCSDPFLVWIELGRVTNRSKRMIRRWRLDRLADDEVKLRYQEALRAAVHSFQRALRVG